MKQILRVHEINPFRTVKYIIDDWKLIRVIRLMGLMVAYKGGYWTNKFPRDRMYLSKILSAMRQYQQDCGLILLILLVLICSLARARNYDYIYLDLIAQFHHRYFAKYYYDFYISNERWYLYVDTCRIVG